MLKYVESNPLMLVNVAISQAYVFCELKLVANPFISGPVALRVHRLMLNLFVASALIVRLLPLMESQSVPAVPFALASCQS